VKNDEISVTYPGAQLQQCHFEEHRGRFELSVIDQRAENLANKLKRTGFSSSTTAAQAINYVLKKKNQVLRQLREI